MLEYKKTPEQRLMDAIGNFNKRKEHGFIPQNSTRGIRPDFTRR